MSLTVSYANCEYSTTELQAGSKNVISYKIKPIVYQIARLKLARAFKQGYTTSICSFTILTGVHYFSKSILFLMHPSEDAKTGVKNMCSL